MTDHEHVWRLGRFRDIDAILGCEVCGLPKGWPETFDRPVSGPGTEFDSPAFRAKQGDTTVAATPEIVALRAAGEAVSEPTEPKIENTGVWGSGNPAVSDTANGGSIPSAPAIPGSFNGRTGGFDPPNPGSSPGPGTTRPKTKANWEWQRKKNRRKMAKQARRKNR